MDTHLKSIIIFTVDAIGTEAEKKKTEFTTLKKNRL